MDINTIANLAKDQKPNRKDTFALVRNMINRGESTDKDLATLYAFFLPKVPAKPKTIRQWVSLAMGKKDVRYYLNYLYSDGSRFVATDGHRLHVQHGINLEVGFYNTEQVKLEVDAKYPDFGRIIPSDGVTDIKYLSDFSNLEVTVIEGHSNMQAVKINDSWFNQQYIRDALSMFNSSDAIDLMQKDDKSPIRLTQGDLLAVVMPTRV